MTAPDGTDAPNPDDNVDDTVQPDAQVADAGDDSGDDPGIDDKVASKLAKANREAKNLRERVKALEAYEQKYKDAEAAKLSDLEKAQNALKAKDDELATLRINNFRRDAALSAGLTGDDIEFITGTTEEECTEQAKKLAKRLAASKPATDLRQGNRGATPAAPVDGNALIRQMAGYT
jgi:hypothetical protein